MPIKKKKKVNRTLSLSSWVSVRTELETRTWMQVVYLGSRSERGRRLRQGRNKEYKGCVFKFAAVNNTSWAPLEPLRRIYAWEMQDAESICALPF